MKEQVVRIDLYTKVVLTVIAACLVWICAAGSGVLTVGSAQAQAGKFGQPGAPTTTQAGPTAISIQAPLRQGAVPVYVVGGRVQTTK